MIPPLPSGGPIEARTTSMGVNGRAKIPPLPSGGPIEAKR